MNSKLAFSEGYRRVFENEENVDNFYQNPLPGQYDSASEYFKILAKNRLQTNLNNDGSNLHLLDVGCGSGKQTQLLANYFGKVTAVDISEAQTTKAKREFPRKNVTYKVGTSSKLPVDGESIDVISCIFSAHYFPDMEKFVNECKRVLKTKGFVGIWGDNLVDIALESKPNTNETAKKLCVELYSEYRKHAISVGACNWHIPDRYQTMFNDITGMEKTLHNPGNFSAIVTLQDFLAFHRSIPVFRDVKWKRFAQKLKQLWTLDSVGNEDIKLRITRAPYVIILKK